MLNAVMDAGWEDTGVWADEPWIDASLDAHAVREDRQEDMRFVRKIPVYEETTLNECWQRKGTKRTYLHKVGRHR